MPDPPVSPGGKDRCGRSLSKCRRRQIEFLKVVFYRSLPLEPADDPDSGLFGFPPIDEPPIDEPPIDEPLPDGLPVKPGEVDPEVPEEGLPGPVVASPGAPGAVAASPVLPPPPIAAPPPAPPAPPPPAPC